MTLSTERRIITVVVIISLTFFLSFALFPVYWMSITSVKPSHEISSTENPLVVLRPTLEHYHKLFTKTRFLYWFKNSVVVSGIATSIVVIVASFGAYSLARLNFRGRKIIGRSVLFSYLIPRIILAIPLFTILGILKLTDTLTGLILSYLTFALPFCTWLLIGYFQSVPTELEESAQIDGCTRVQALFKIVFPLVTQVLSLLVFLHSHSRGTNFFTR
ncbi:MAG: hypothetical protein DRP89_08850 [Candidatus Neomarinimicrobiota bacterium]|nr:MAG: hypothetical protein DRP89_08850 [Candidatus Neomarinimicrobiota bacterium]